MSKTATIVALGRANVEKAFGTNFGAARCPESHDPLEAWAGPRPILENNNNFLQPIPYVIVKARISGRDRYISYRRGKEGNEERLRDKVSIGIGGHVDVCHAKYRGDGSIDVLESVRAAAAREMEEEIGVKPSPDEFGLVGLIHTDATAVSRVHLGFVYVWDAGPFIESGRNFEFEPGIDRPEFLTRDQILGPDIALEDWSKLALDLI